MGNLVLERKVGQSIVICDGEIVVTVKEVRGNRVSLRFVAAKDLSILRKEIVSAEVKKKLAEVAL
jgi:carbon storage regulator CsrA